MLSVIIPARNESYLQKTIGSILESAEGEIEIVAVLDGYWPDPPIIDDPRVKLIHHTESIGQRGAINEAVKIARGKYILKTDAHSMFDKGFDVKLAADCEYDWTVIPRMYNLDDQNWRPKFHKCTDYMYIGCGEGRELRSEYYGSRQPKNDIEIDDVMTGQGACWFMHKDRFWELGGMDEGHGGWGQMGVEVALKAWLSGGSLKVNKKTWFSHWFRGGHGPGFPYPITGRLVEQARDYSRDLWLNNKWSLQKRPFKWIIDKFNPPGWEGVLLKEDEVAELNTRFRKHIHERRRDPKWRGVTVIKQPTDLVLYQQAIWDRKPDFIIDVGTAFGGSALMFADYLDMVGKGTVISIDVRARSKPEHPRIKYLTGSSTSADILKAVKDIVGDGSVMVVLDSDHSRVHVKWELHRYSKIVTSGQYLVIEDCYGRHGKLTGPGEARDWFLRTSAGKGFVWEHPDEQFIVGFSRGGWLRKK